MSKFGSGFFRLFLACLVVLNHSSPLRLGSWAVYVFFILSGYWICRLWRRQYAQTHRPLLTFLVSRWWRLTPVFLVCTCIGLGSSFVLQGDAALHLAKNPVWWLRQLVIAGSNQAGTDLPPSWSLDVEMQFYLVAPLLVTLFLWVGPSLRYLTAAAGCAWFVVFFFLGGNPHMAHFSLFMGFFLVGITLEMTDWRPSRRTALGSLLLFFGINLVLAIIPETRRFVWRTDSDTDPTSADLLFIAFRRLWMVVGVGVVIPFLAWNVSRHSSRFDRFLGNLAYPLYLFHWIPMQWYYHFSRSDDPIWKQCAFLVMNFFSAGTGALTILFLVDRRSERLRAAWVASRGKNLPASMPEVATATMERMKPY